MPGDTPPLRDYQDKGVAWLCGQLRQHKAVLLADDMGLGKTLQALRAAARLDAKRILIVCPAGARRVWQAEIQRWLPAWSSRVVLIEPGIKLPNVKLTLDAPQFVLIVGYDEFSARTGQLVNHLRARRFDLLVLDEAHYLKNPSNRTLAIYGHRGSQTGVQACAGKVILLSGTPTPNHAGELWQHYRTFWPTLLRTDIRASRQSLTQTEFENRFCRYRDTPFGRQVTGSKNQTILRHSLKDVILRRRKDEVLAELPPLILQDISLTSGPPNWISQLRPETKAAAARLDHTGRYMSDDELLKMLRQPDGAIATVRRELGLLKVGPALAWLHERLASTDKVLIFAWHHEVLDRLAAGLAEYAPAVVTGKTTPAARALAVEDFQTCPATRVFIGQILAAGTAITLTAASEVAIVEPSWVPGENVQAIARAHRLGQRDSVLASFLFLPGTLDQRIMQTFRRKAAEIGELQGDIDASAA